MGFFDFLKPKADPLRELENNPEFAKQILFSEFEYIRKQVSNLQTVGREQDARRTISAFLKKIVALWSKNPSDPFPIKYLAYCCIALSVPELGREVIESFVEDPEISNILDATWPFWELGKLEHQIRNDGARELHYYERAFLAKAPKNCQFPAKRQHKAAICHFAHLCAHRINNRERADFFEMQRNALAPEVDWSKPESSIAFIQMAAK